MFLKNSCEEIYTRSFGQNYCTNNTRNNPRSHLIKKYWMLMKECGTFHPTVQYFQYWLPKICDQPTRLVDRCTFFSANAFISINSIKKKILSWGGLVTYRNIYQLHRPAFFKLFQIARRRAHYSGSFFPADFEYLDHFFPARPDLPNFFVKSLKITLMAVFS